MQIITDSRTETLFLIIETIMKTILMHSGEINIKLPKSAQKKFPQLNKNQLSH
jgi:hypothetical protein